MDSIIFSFEAVVFFLLKTGYFFIFLFFIFFVFLEPHLRHMEDPRLRGRIRTVAASLRHSSRQRQILNPLIKAGD